MTTTVRVPSGSKWDCRGCGDCCRLYELGPVEPGIVRGLEERRIQDHWAPAAEKPWYEVRRAPDGREAYFLTHRDGHCVFLRDDNLCAVHGLFGAAAKPAFCREFPFHVLDDPKGTVVVVRPSCSGLHHSRVDGKPLQEHVPEVLALPRVMPRRKVLSGEVALLPGHVVPLDAYMAVETELLALLDGPAADPEVLVARLRGALLKRTGGEARPDAKKARLAAGAVLEALRRLMAKAASPEPGQDPHRVAFAREAAQLLEEGTRGLANPGAFGPDAKDYLQGLLRTFVLAKGFQALGGVAEGLGFFLVQAALVRAAADIGSGGLISAEQAGPIVVKWTKLTENPAIQGILKLTRPALVDLFLSA